MLTLLAQINLSDLPNNDVFPGKGLLQFFILNAEDANHYKVVFHKEIDSSVALPDIAQVVPSSLMSESVVFTSDSGQQIEAVNPYWGEAGFPTQGELALKFSKEYESANLTEDCFHEEFKKAATQLNIPLPEDFDNVYDIDFLNEEDEESPLNEYYTGSSHKLFGRPYFIQRDCRDSDDEILLLQIDSAEDTEIFGETNENNFIEIGDVGIMHFFIKKDDLKKLDFSNIDYEWGSH